MDGNEIGVVQYFCPLTVCNFSEREDGYKHISVMFVNCLLSHHLKSNKSKQVILNLKDIYHDINYPILSTTRKGSQVVELYNVFFYNVMRFLN